jgi:ribose transport system permease protein
MELMQGKVTEAKPRRLGIGQKLGPLAGLFAIVLVVSIMEPDFLTLNNLFNILRQVSINALIAFGMTFVILTGGIDLSVGSILALSSAFVAGLMTDGTSALIAVRAGLIVGAVMGALNGMVISLGKVAPFIATLATMTIFRGLTLVYMDGKPITRLSQGGWFELFGRGYFWIFPVPVLTMLIAFAVLYFILKKTTIGRYTYAIGGNEEAAKLMGIQVNKVKIMIYSLPGLMAALAGIILTSRLNSAQPTAGTSYELDAIAAVDLGGTSLSGGRGWIVGTLIGALIIGTLNNGLNLLGVSSFFQLVVKGLLILFAVLADRKQAA